MIRKEETIDPFLSEFTPVAEANAEVVSATDKDQAVPVGEAKKTEELQTTEAKEAVEEQVSVEENQKAQEAQEAQDSVAEKKDEVTEEEVEPLTILEVQKLEEEVIEALRSVFDPEIPVNIYELGLIYQIKIDRQARCVIQMTLTSPACPVAGSLPGEVEMKALSVDGIRSSRVELVWEPAWTPDMMSESAQLELGFF